MVHYDHELLRICSKRINEYAVSADQTSGLSPLITYFGFNLAECATGVWSCRRLLAFVVRHLHRY